MYLLFDIGGTRTRVAYSADGATIGDHVSFETPAHCAEGVEAIVQAAHSLGAFGNITAASGGVPGILDEKKAGLLSAPHLPAWAGEPFVDLLSTALGVPVYIENDATLAGLGEAHHGAGRGVGIMEYITVSTGVGGTRIVDGRIDEKALGFEPGKEILSFEAGSVHTFEDAVSGTALEKKYGRKPKDIHEPEVWEELSVLLARGLYNTILLWSPDVIVLGGSMITGNPAIPLERTKAHMMDTASVLPRVPDIRKAELGDVGGLWGALEYIKQYTH